jgi:CspA family cold shock protein
MGRGNDYRQDGQRRVIDDGGWSGHGAEFGGGADRLPSPVRPNSARPNPARPEDAEGGRETTAVVKWFKVDKGFGFVTLDDGTGDAFLHANALRSVGLESVVPGSTMSVSVNSGPKGLQVVQVHGVDASSAAVPQQRPSRPHGDGGPAVEVDGTVKWFNAEKGFGFLAADDGGRDVFVHVSALRSSSVADLSDGDRVAMRVATTAKGREAVSLRLL